MASPYGSSLLSLCQTIALKKRTIESFPIGRAFTFPCSHGTMNRQKAVANHLTSIFHQGTQGISLTSANSKIASALNILCLLRYVFTFQFLSFDVFLSVWLSDCVIRTLVASPGISFLDFPFFPVFPEKLSQVPEYHGNKSSYGRCTESSLRRRSRLKLNQPCAIRINLV